MQVRVTLRLAKCLATGPATPNRGCPPGLEKRPNSPMSILLRSRLALFVITICAAGYWTHIVAASRPTMQFSAVAAATYVENDLCKNRITSPASKPVKWGIGCPASTTLPVRVASFQNRTGRELLPHLESYPASGFFETSFDRRSAPSDPRPVPKLGPLEIDHKSAA